MKKVLYVILGLVVLYLILCLVGPKGATVTRSTTINAPVQQVQMKMADLKFFQEQWSPWTERDPQMQVTYLGEPGKEGYGYSWKGNDEVGQGTLTVVGFSGDSLLQKLSFEGMGDSKAFYVVNGKDAGTNVTWGISMDYGFLSRGMMLFMNMDKMMGADFEHGLDKLKKAIESMPAEPSTAKLEVKETEWPETSWVGSKREVVGVAEMQAYFGKHFPAIGEACGKEKVEPQGAPTALYWSFDEKTMKGDLAAVFKVANGTKLKGFETYTFPSAKVLHVEYYGDYSKIMNAHMAIDAHMKEKGIDGQTAVFEEYVTDPGTEKDTTKWLTNVYYLLKPAK